MSESVVHKWFKNQRAKGIDKAYTIREVYKALKLIGNPRCIETVWFQIVKLRETKVLDNTLSIPIRYRLKSYNEEQE